MFFVFLSISCFVSDTETHVKHIYLFYSSNIYNLSILYLFPLTVMSSSHRSLWTCLRSLTAGNILINVSFRSFISVNIRFFSRKLQHKQLKQKNTFGCNCTWFRQRATITWLPPGLANAAAAADLPGDVLHQRQVTSVSWYRSIAHSLLVRHSFVR